MPRLKTSCQPTVAIVHIMASSERYEGHGHRSDNGPLLRSRARPPFLQGVQKCPAINADDLVMGPSRRAECCPQQMPLRERLL